MPFNYIETTCEPTLNMSVPLDESSLELYPLKKWCYPVKKDPA